MRRDGIGRLSFIPIPFLFFIKKILSWISYPSKCGIRFSVKFECNYHLYIEWMNKIHQLCSLINLNSKLIWEALTIPALPSRSIKKGKLYDIIQLIYIIPNTFTLTIKLNYRA